MTSTTSNDSAKPEAHDLEIDGVRVSVHGKGIALAIGDGTGLGDARDALALLDALRVHEDQLRESAQAAEDRQRWDEAYRIASDLMGQGHKVREIGSDLIRQSDGYRSVMAVKVDDLAAVEATGAKVTRQPRAAGSKYDEVTSEPAPGIVVAATVEATEPREVTDPSVAPAVTR